LIASRHTLLSFFFVLRNEITSSLVMLLLRDQCTRQTHVYYIVSYSYLSTASETWYAFEQRHRTVRHQTACVISFRLWYLSLTTCCL